MYLSPLSRCIPFFLPSFEAILLGDPLDPLRWYSAVRIAAFYRWGFQRNSESIYFLNVHIDVFYLNLSEYVYTSLLRLRDISVFIFFIEKRVNRLTLENIEIEG